MVRRTTPLLLILIITFAALANDEKEGNPWANYDWSFERLPRFETKQERESGAVPSLDRITPPPEGPVFLDPEFGEREGIIVRYPFGYGNLLAEMVDNLQDFGIVYIIVENAAVESDCYNFLTSNGVPWENIECIYAPSNTMWSRDYGPWFVWEEDNTLSIVDMIYYPSRPDDDYIPEFLETYWGMGYYGPNMYHEGGNMMTDGHGTMMMSTRIFEANPGFTAEDVNEIYHNYFGQDTTYIFQAISQDATGHIDLWAKIVNDTTILVAQMQPDDVNYQLVENHAARMDEIPTYNGGTFHIVRCPMPPVSYWWIFPYYKSYINSVLFNNLALIPIYGLQYDDDAIAAYQEALGPDWTVIGVDCNSIAFAGGAIHCSTIGVPEHDELYMHSVDFTFEPVSPPITIPADGGVFDFNAGVENLENQNIIIDFWIDVVLPDSTEYGPVFKRTNISLTALSNISRELSQSVPSAAPAGEYSYRGYVGSYLPLIVIAQDSFIFSKEAAGNGSFEIGDWFVSGWDESEIHPVAGVPQSFILEQNHPNPFNQETIISFELYKTSNISISIYNIGGQLVEIIDQGIFAPGSHTVVWNAENMPSGVYFYSLRTPNASQTKKMILMK